jgi:hypothetical protein
MSMNISRGRAVRRSILASVVLSGLLATGIAAPAAASPQWSASAEVASPARDAERHLSSGSEVTKQALAITSPSSTTRPSAKSLTVDADDVLIAGQVQDWTGAGAHGALVSVYSASWDGATPYEYSLSLVQTVETDSLGNFSVAVPQGYYKLFFNPVNQPDTAWMWDSGGAYLGAYPQAVEASGWSGPWVLPRGYDVGGQVTGGPGSAAVEGARVTLWAGELRSAEEIWFEPVAQTESEAGSYALPQVSEGYYLIEVESTDPRYVGEWWNNKRDFATSDIIDLWSADVTANVNLGQYAHVLPALAVGGVPAVGSTVKVDVPSKVSGVTYGYAWYADGVYISGSLGKSSIKLTSSQHGKQISAKVTASKSGYVTSTRVTPRTTRVIAHSAPTITGPTAVGYTLVAKPNTWTSGTAFKYQWYADGVAVPGATSSSFKLALAQRDKRITVRVWGSKAGFTTVWRGSAATAKVGQVAKPKISGTAKVGQRLYASTTGWTPGTTFRFQWYASGAAISGATSSSMFVGSSLVGKTITVKVTGSKSGYNTYSQTSLSTARVVR